MRIFNVFLASLLHLLITLAVVPPSLSAPEGCRNADKRHDVVNAAMALDSAWQYSLAGLYAKGILCLDEMWDRHGVEISAAQRHKNRGMRAMLCSELGLYTLTQEQIESMDIDISSIPDSRIIALLGLYYYRVGKKEEAFRCVSDALHRVADKEIAIAGARLHYCWALLCEWEALNTEALEHYETASHLSEAHHGYAADAARIWMAYGAALEKAGHIADACTAYQNAQGYAEQVSLLRNNLAPQLAILSANAQMRLSDPAQAKAFLREAARLTDDRTSVSIQAQLDQAHARIAMLTDDRRTAMRNMRNALWNHYRVLMQNEKTRTREEVVKSRQIAESALNMAFAMLLHGSQPDGRLAAAAWNVYFAIRNTQSCQNVACSLTGSLAAQTWFAERLHCEQRMMGVAVSESVRGPTLSTFQNSLAPGSGAMLIHRFKDMMSSKRHACYVALSLSSEGSGSRRPCMFWLDPSGELEQRWFPHFISQLEEPLQLRDVYEWQKLPAALSTIAPDTLSWNILGERILQHFRYADPIHIMPDGLFCLVDPALLYDPATGEYMLDKRRVGTLIAAEIDSVSVSQQEFEKPIITEQPVEHSVLSSGLFTEPLRGSRWHEPSLATFFLAMDDTISDAEYPKANRFFHLGPYHTESILRRSLNERLLMIDAPIFLLGMPMEQHPIAAPIPHWQMDPFLRSGLLLADAKSVTEALGRHAVMCSADDGVLLAEEIASMQMDSIAVVFLPRSMMKQEIMELFPASLTFIRSFLNAGVASVFYCAWYIPKKIINDFLLHFQRAYESRGSVEEAYYVAQRKLRDAYPHPYIWGGFRLAQ